MEKTITATGLESREWLEAAIADFEERAADETASEKRRESDARWAKIYRKFLEELDEREACGGAIPRKDASKMAARAGNAADLLDSIAWYYRGAFLSDVDVCEPYTPEWALFWAHAQADQLRMSLERFVAFKFAKGAPASVPLSRLTKFACCTADKETCKDVEETALAARDCFLGLKRLLEGKADPAPESKAELEERLAIDLNAARAGIELLREHIRIG